MRQYQSTWKYLVIPVLIVITIIPACTEKGPDIELTDEQRAFKDTTYVASTIQNQQQKHVVLEEFTGVRCVNCPEADSLITDLLNEHDNLIALSYHNGNFALPYGNDRDLSCQEASKLDDFLGPVSGRPIATVDRKTFNAESELLLGTGKWANYVSQRTEASTPVNIDLTTRYEDSTRNLLVEVSVHYTSPENQTNRLTVAITESDIKTKQALGQGEKDSAYIQEHVLVHTLTSAKGTTLNESLEEGRTITKSYEKKMPEEWVAPNCQVVAFVSRSGSSKTILHGAKESVR